MVEFTSEKSKKIELARLDIVHQWLDFRKKSTNKLQADYDFVNLHNTSNSYLFEILGKISRGTLHRWKNILYSTALKIIQNLSHNIDMQNIFADIIH